MAHTPESRKCNDCQGGCDGGKEFTILCPLHAAASQLLEACEKALDVLDGTEFVFTAAIVRDAIRAAKGE